MIQFFVDNADMIKLTLVITLLLASISLVIFLIFRKIKKKIVSDSNDEIVNNVVSTNEPGLEKQMIEVENVLSRMQRDLEEPNEEGVKSFEEEQEEKSIISYQELLNITKNNVEEEKPKFQTTDFISPVHGRVDNDSDYPIIKKFKSLEQQQENLIADFKYEEPEKPVKFDIGKSTRSNMFDQDSKEFLDLEKTINAHSLKEEMHKNEQFLKALKEFRNSLE